MVQHTVTVMGKKVAYWERNPYGAPTIVMLHGFRGNHMGLTDLAQHFAGFRLILPDLPGYGESEAMAQVHTIGNYAWWLDEFVEALGLDANEWVSFSHSYSGSIALIQAAEGRQRPMAMISVSPPAIRRDFALWLSTAYYQVGRMLPLGWRRRWLASHTVDGISSRLVIYNVSEARRQELVKRGRRNLAFLDPQVVTEGYLSALKVRPEEYAPEVTVPALIVAGAHDIIVPLPRLERLVALIPDGTLVVMEDQGHLAPIERPAATATISKRFINGLVKG